MDSALSPYALLP
jgi:hypothetical protein